MREFNRAVRVGCVLTLGWCAAAISQTARADVLSQVPSDAAIVVKLNHISDTNQKLQSLLQQLGLTDLVPTLKDPLQSLEDATGFGPGFDTKGEAALFFMANDLSSSADPGDKLVVLLPVSDYKAFLAAQQVVRTEDETTIVHFKGQETDEFIQQWGEYAAVAASRQGLSIKHDGLKASGTSAEQLTGDDLVIYTNFSAIRPLLLPKLDDGQKQLLDLIDKQVKDPAMQKISDAAAKQLIQGTREFLNDAQGCTYGITLSSGGIKGTLAVDFAPDSYLGNLVKTAKQSDGSLVAGLPKESYLAFGGFVNDPAWSAKLFDDLVNPIAAELPGLGDNGTKIINLIAVAKDALTTSEGGVFGVVTPSGAAGQQSMVQEVFVIKGDSEKIKNAQTKGAELTSSMMNAMMQLVISQAGGGKPAAAGDLMKSTRTPNYKTINGVTFDRWQVQVDPDNATAEAAKINTTLSTMYGPDGVSAVSGTIDAKTYIGGVVAPDQLLSDTIDSAKSGQDVLSDTVKEIDAQLPKNRMLVEYVGLGQYLSTVLNYMKANGVPVNVSVPNNLPPLGMTIGGQDTSLRADGYIPVPLIQGLVQTGMQAYMQIQGRQNNNGGGGGL